MVSTLRRGVPRLTTDFSISVDVGHTWTQAPQDTHSEPRKSVGPAATLEPKPRPSMVRAKVPWVSSQARTQREHTMHFDGSNSKYGLLRSFSASRWFAPA